MASSSKDSDIPYGLITPGNMLAPSIRAMMRNPNAKPTPASPTCATSVIIPERFKSWDSVAISLGFIDTDEETDLAADQLKRWLCNPEGPFWPYWIEYSLWDVRSPRPKPRLWRFPQVYATRDSPIVTDSSPNWSTLMAPQFIARFIVRFLNAAISDSTVVSFNKENNTSEFTHAFAVCQFVKDQTLEKECLKISQEEREAFLLSAKWFRKDFSRERADTTEDTEEEPYKLRQKLNASHKPEVPVEDTEDEEPTTKKRSKNRKDASRKRKVPAEDIDDQERKTKKKSKGKNKAVL
ncbi:MAG: hypothetical protein M1840_001140 [Geoglossum simile]|nr:MAG: hypothetical protein M1840_001140 [Geoglossum simile]